MKKLLTITAAVLLMAVMTLSQTPAPVIPPGDPNSSMGSYVLMKGQILDTQCIIVYSDANAAPAVTATYTSFAAPFKRTDGQWQYNWTVSISTRGTFYDYITITDQYGFDRRPIKFKVVDKPIITACGGR